MMLNSLVQGVHVHAAEIWLPLVQPAGLDRTFTTFVQQFFHLGRKIGPLDVYLLTNAFQFVGLRNSRRFPASLYCSTVRRVAAPMHP